MSAENRAASTPDDGGTLDILGSWADSVQMLPPEDPAMKLQAFSKGNKLWQLGVHKIIAKQKYQSAEQLLNACFGYFEWLENNPLMEAKLVTYEGVSTVEELPKMRSPTLAGLCLYLGIHRDTWGAWRRGDNRKDLAGVVELIEQKMYDDKFTGAAAGLLNPSMVIRDLGLVEKQQVDNKTTVVIDGDEAEL